MSVLVQDLLITSGFGNSFIGGYVSPEGSGLRLLLGMGSVTGIFIV